MLRISLQYQLKLSLALKRLQISENLFFSEVTWTTYEGVFEYTDPFLYLSNSIVPIYLPDIKDGLGLSTINPLIIKAKARDAQTIQHSQNGIWRIDRKYQTQLVQYARRFGLNEDEFFSHIKIEAGWEMSFNPAIAISIKCAKGYKTVTTRGIRQFINRQNRTYPLRIGNTYKNIVEYHAIELGINLSTLYKHIEWTEDNMFECLEDQVTVELRTGESFSLLLEGFRQLCLGEEVS